MQMCSVCRTSAAAVLSRRSLLTQCQLGLLVRPLWEAGDLASTLCMAQPAESLREQQDMSGSWKYGKHGGVDPAGTHTGMCCAVTAWRGIAFLLSHLPNSFHHPWEWDMVKVLGHSRNADVSMA